MQFIKNGPDIPDTLLQAQEDGNIVFFCGAGISYPAKLPGFKDLVKKLYDAIGELPNDIERLAMKKGQYDTAISLIEERIVGGREQLRVELFNILKPDYSAPKATKTHESLLTLSCDKNNCYKIVTTNFDRIFQHVIENNRLSIDTFQSPFLPIPKKRWDGGLVYLHGLLPEAPDQRDLNRLVISSGDFGLAYLTERWAARFVSELFRNFIICFVGYSINDPVLRYMMDALAADRQLGESSPEFFGFGCHSKGREEETTNEWRAKNITPIMYRNYKNHYYLHKTLHAWADTYHDGINAKEHIVVQYALSRPTESTKQDNFVGRMLWALSDASGIPAKRFAEHEPTPSFEWLNTLSETRFRVRDLVRYNEECKLDCVMFQIARWLKNHVNEPKLILWIAKQGGAVHERFARQIIEGIKEKSPNKPLQILWQLVLSDRLYQRKFYAISPFDWRKLIEYCDYTNILRLQLRDLLTPRIQLRDPLPNWLGNNNQESAHERVKDFIAYDIVFEFGSDRKLIHELMGNPPTLLPYLLEDFTSLLHDTLDLMHEMEDTDDKHDSSYIYQPSISDHPQNKGIHDWTILIELVRDSWIATVSQNPEKAKHEIYRWITIPYPLFKRFVYFATTESDLISSEQALNWLLIDNNWWLWSYETEHEALLLLIKLIPNLNNDGYNQLEEALITGPPRDMFRDDLSPEDLQRISDRKIWFRLAKCKEAGITLSTTSENLFHDLSQQHEDLRLAIDGRDAFPFWMGANEDIKHFTSTPKTAHDLVEWLIENPEDDYRYENDWHNRCKNDYRRAVVALTYLAKRGEWIPARWCDALYVWEDQDYVSRSWKCISEIMVEAPNRFLKQIIHALCGWLNSLAKVIDCNEKTFFILINKVISFYRKETIESDSDPVTAAINHPIGLATDSVLRWWYRQSLVDNQGLSGDVKRVFTELCDLKIKAYKHGRVLLSKHLITLFRVDTDWTRGKLLPLFDWSSSINEATAAWEGFLLSPRLYWPLIDAIKPHFLDTANHYLELGEYGDQYVSLLTYASIELRNTGEVLTRKDIRTATSILPLEGRERATFLIAQTLESAGDKKKYTYWNNHIKPYFKHIWPKSKDNKTQNISKNIARICVAADGSFPDALDDLKVWLLPLENSLFVINQLINSKLCELFPDESLDFLNKIFNENTFWPPEQLKDCLLTISRKKPELKNDHRYRNFLDYMNRHDID